MKFRYIFKDPRDEDCWIIDYAEIKGTELVFSDNTDYSKYTIVDIHQHLFTTPQGFDVYEYDYIHVVRGDSLKDHVSQVQKGQNGGAVIYHDALAKLGHNNGIEDATYWMSHETSISQKEPQVYFHCSYEDFIGENE